MFLLWLLLMGYFVGSIPTGFLLMKFTKGIDIRNVGSSSTGATNVLRSGNKILASFTLLIDVLKGLILSLALMFAKIPTEDRYFALICCLIGHSFPVWTKFKGGKGVATSAGIFLTVSPIITFIAVAIWAAVAKIFKISSVASLSFVSSFVGFITIKYYLKHCEFLDLLFVLEVFVFLIFSHYENILRIFQHCEGSVCSKK